MLGVGTLVAKDVIQVGRAGLMLTGAAGLLITVLAVVLIMGWSPPWVVSLLVGLVFSFYVGLSSLREPQLRRRPLPHGLREFLCGALAEVDRDARPDQTSRSGGLFEFLSVVPTLVAIVGGSMVMVESAAAIGDRWHVPGAVLGMLVLAALTGVPNLIAAIRLARRGRGTAVLSEALNSNSLNRRARRSGSRSGGFWP